MIKLALYLKLLVPNLAVDLTNATQPVADGRVVPSDDPRYLSN